MQVWLRQTSWMQRVFAVLLALNAVLIIVGGFIVLATFRSAAGIASMFGAIVVQIVLAVLAFTGPLAFARFPKIIGISAGFGVSFAALYLGVIIREFMGISDTYNLLLLFIIIGLLAGAVGGYVGRRWQDGIVAAIWALLMGTAWWSLGILLLNYLTWGNSQQYTFWLGDGAVTEFQQQGGGDLYVFILQDIQGALFYHPILSAVIGAIVGTLGSALAQAGLWLQGAAHQRLTVR